MAPQSSAEKFVHLFAGAQHDVYRYIVALLGDSADAHEVMQETSVALWRKFDAYDPAMPFVPWARRFAFYEVRKFRERKSRGELLLDDDVMEMVSVEHARHSDLLDSRRDALRGCLSKLGDRDRELIDHRYSSSMSIQQIAKQSGRSAHTMYKTLERIRKNLFDCIDRSMRQEGAA